MSSERHRAMLARLREVEETLHARGWDHSASAWLIRTGEVEEAPALPTPDAIKSLMAATAPPADLDMLEALAVSYEAWGHCVYDMSGDPTDDRASLEGVQDARVVIAVGLDGSRYAVIRVNEPRRPTRRVMYSPGRSAMYRAAGSDILNGADPDGREWSEPGDVTMPLVTDLDALTQALTARTSR